MFFRGYFSQGDERYFIEPLSPTNRDEQEHALFKHDPEAKKTNATCGRDDLLWAHVARSATSLVVCIPFFFIWNGLMYPVLSVLGSSLSNYTLLKFCSHC